MSGSKVLQIPLEENWYGYFIPLQGSNGQLVYVNPERINYIRTRNEKTVLYFDKDQSVDLEGSIAEVRALLNPSTSSEILRIGSAPLKSGGKSPPKSLETQ